MQKPYTMSVGGELALTAHVSSGGVVHEWHGEWANWDALHGSSGMHGPHFVIGGQYRRVVCLHFPSAPYGPATYGTTTGPTLQSPNQRGSSMSSVVALDCA